MNRLDTRSRARFGATLLTLWLGLGAVGCSDLWEVENPNNVVGDDIMIASAAQALANGALFQLQSGYSYTVVVYATASDELHWVGSRDAFQQLDFGHIEYFRNEFSDEAFKDMATARWMFDKAITILESHLAGDSLADESALAEAYLWGAIGYVAIADAYDDFVFSDMMVASPAIGAANMGALYTTAIGYCTSALALDIGSDLALTLTAMRAKARFAQGRWNLIGQRPITTGLLAAGDVAAAATDAAAALLMDNSDWTYYLEFVSAGTYGEVQGAVNSRLEMRFGSRYIIPSGTDKTRDRDATDNGIALQDPIDAMGDPRLDVFMTQWEDAAQYADLPILSAREMYLILAEDALVRGDNAAFMTNINASRTFGGLSDWTAGSGVTQQDMLIHERQVNLYLQLHRLNDMYRFGIESDMWQASSTAVTAPGTFIPITMAEIDANCFLNPNWPADVPCGG